jgi:hypothetical protein
LRTNSQILQNKEELKKKIDYFKDDDEKHNLLEKIIMTFLNVLFSYIDDIYEAVSVHFK